MGNPTLSNTLGQMGVQKYPHRGVRRTELQNALFLHGIRAQSVIY